MLYKSLIINTLCILYAYSSVNPNSCTSIEHNVAIDEYQTNLEIKFLGGT
eukprot:UN05103